MLEHEIVIKVAGGEVQDVTVPAGCNASIVVFDHDVETFDPDHSQVDTEGHPYTRSRYLPAGACSCENPDVPWYCGLPGVLARMKDGKLDPPDQLVKRCQFCARFQTDKDATVELRAFLESGQFDPVSRVDRRVLEDVVASVRDCLWLDLNEDGSEELYTPDKEVGGANFIDSVTSIYERHSLIPAEGPGYFSPVPFQPAKEEPLPAPEMTPDEILRELAAEALEVQDACNSCGLAQRFAKVMIALQRHPQSSGTDWVNQHPITQLWLDKLCDLARIERSTPTSAWDDVQKIADST